MEVIKLKNLPLEEQAELLSVYPTCSDEHLKELAQRYGYAHSRSFCNAMRKYFNVFRWRSLHSTPTEQITTDYELPPDSSWEEHIRIIKDLSKLVAFHQQVPFEININIKAELPIVLVHTSDWQLGQFGVDYDSWAKDMSAIEIESGCYVAIGGDAHQNIIQPAKMGSSHDQVPIPIQKGLLVLTYKKLINKILYIGTGQHDYWAALAIGEDWLGEIARHLRLVYTKHSAKINLKVGKMDYSILRMHKSQFHSSFNLTHTCKQNQRLYFPDARIVIAEDKHVAAIEQYRYNGRECLAIRTGTYSVYDDYAKQNGFFGSHVANPTVVLFPNEDKLVGFKDMYDAFVYLRAVRK